MSLTRRPSNSSNFHEKEKKSSIAEQEQVQSQSTDSNLNSNPTLHTSSNSYSNRHQGISKVVNAFDSHPSVVVSSIPNEKRTAIAGLQATSGSSGKYPDRNVPQSHKHSAMHLQSGSLNNHEDQLQYDQQSVTPILIALLPSILSTLTGHSWMEYCLLALVLFYLYMILKVPGDLLIQTRSKATTFYSGQNETLFQSWKKRESQALAMYSLAPIVGGLGLYYTQIILPNATLLKHFSASLFFLCAFIKPFLYLTGLVKDSFLVEIPSTSSDTFFGSKKVLELDKCNQQIALLEKKMKDLETSFDERVEEKCKHVMEPLAKTLHFYKKEKKKEGEGLQVIRMQLESQQAAFSNLNSQVQSQRSNLLIGNSKSGDSNQSGLNLNQESVFVPTTNSDVSANQLAERSISIATTLSREMKSITSLTESLSEKMSLMEYRLDSSQEELYEFHSEIQEQVRNVSKLVQIYHGDVQSYLSSTLGSFSLAKQGRHIGSVTPLPSVPSSSLFKIVKSFFDFTLVPILQIPLFFYCLIFGEDYPTLSSKPSPITPHEQLGKPSASVDFFMPPPPPIPPILSLPYSATSFAFPGTSVDQSGHSQRRNSEHYEG